MNALDEIKLPIYDGTKEGFKLIRPAVDAALLHAFEILARRPGAFDSYQLFEKFGRFYSKATLSKQAKAFETQRGAPIGLFGGKRRESLPQSVRDEIRKKWRIALEAKTPFVIQNLPSVMRQKADPKLVLDEVRALNAELPRGGKPVVVFLKRAELGTLGHLTSGTKRVLRKTRRRTFGV